MAAIDRSGSQERMEINFVFISRAANLDECGVII